MNYMFKSKAKLILVFVFLFIAGCGYKQTNLQSQDVAYLKFNKSTFQEYTVVVNDKYTFKLDACAQKDNNEQCVSSTYNKLFEVSSGNVVLKVFDSNNNLIMRKEMYIGISNTVEINLK